MPVSTAKRARQRENRRKGGEAWQKNKAYREANCATVNNTERGFATVENLIVPLPRKNAFGKTDLTPYNVIRLQMGNVKYK